MVADFLKSIMFATLSIKMKFLKSCYLLLFLILSLAMAIPAYAKIYYSKQEAMELAFGSEATVEMMSLFLTDSDVEKIQQLARVKVDSALFTFYVGKKAGELIGYAAIETHKVRTLPAMESEREGW